MRNMIFVAAENEYKREMKKGLELCIVCSFHCNSFGAICHSKFLDCGDSDAAAATREVNRKRKRMK